jgi:phage portal protein BeeE
MMSLADAQWIESSKMRIEDIARFFGVPLHLIQSLDRATNNNIEHQSLDFLNHSLAPQLDNAAQEMTFKLLTEEEQADMYIGHIKQAIMSVDSRSRAEYLMRMHQMGVLNGDMIADLEDVNRPTDGRGQVYYVPVNLAPAMTPDEAKKKMEADAAPPAPPEPPDPSGDDSNDDDADEEVAQ